MPLVRLIMYMPESRTEPILKVLIEKIYEKNKAVYLLNSELYIEYNQYILCHLLSVNCRPDIFFDCTALTALNDLDIEGTYVWDHSNAPLTFSNWHYHEPSLLSKSEALTKDCIDILRGGIWNDRPCSYLNWVICEKSFWTRLPPWWSWRSDFKFQPTLILKKTTVYYYCMFSLIFPQ